MGTIHLTLDLDPIRTWAIGREAIRLRRACGELPPWTADPILNDWRFCNVRREDDRVTRWIDHHIRVPFEGHRHLWFMLCAARVINWPPTLEELITSRVWPVDDGFDPIAMGTALEARASRGEKVFTGAYLITAPPVRGTKKTAFVAESTLGSLWRDRDLIGELINGYGELTPTLCNVHGVLSQYPGWGPFMAYQAVADMRFTPLLAEAIDVSRWAAAGPGTIRGLNRVHGRPVYQPLTQHQALEELLEIYERFEAATGIAIDLSDVPNVMCETDKYLRIKLGEGFPRARYVYGRGA